jgi:hypothetical protein
VEAPHVRHVLEPQIPTDAPVKQFPQLLVWIVHRDVRRNVDEHASGHAQPQRVGQCAHDDLGHKTRRCLSGTTQLGVEDTRVGIDQHRPRTAAAVGTKYPEGAICLH